VLTAQLRALQETAVLDQPSELAVLLEHVASQAVHLLGNDRCVVYRLEGDGGSLAPEAWAGAPLEEHRDDDADLRTAASQAVDLRRAVVERACLAVPLVVRDEVLGAIVFSDREGHAYHDEDLDVARTFGDQVALAVENARLRGRVERAAAAAERVRLARELHDSVTQSLFAASLKADVVAETCVAPTPRLSQALEDLRRLTRGALAEMRSMLLEMRPDALLRTPLSELLRHLAEAAQSKARIRVDLSVSSGRTLPEEVHVTFYRVAQEALNNAVRHAAASSARIELTDAEAMVLTVADDGEGFDLAAVSPDRFGIVSMRERATSVGADLTIETAPGSGTVVRLEWRSDERDRPADG
jgi:signal transduction histidine kinase